jgi:hypothetical protein
MFPRCTVLMPGVVTCAAEEQGALISNQHYDNQDCSDEILKCIITLTGPSYFVIIFHNENIHQSYSALTFVLITCLNRPICRWRYKSTQNHKPSQLILMSVGRGVFSRHQMF